MAVLGVRSDHVMGRIMGGGARCRVGSCGGRIMGGVTVCQQLELLEGSIGSWLWWRIMEWTVSHQLELMEDFCCCCCCCYAGVG